MWFEMVKFDFIIPLMMIIANTSPLMQLREFVALNIFFGIWAIKPSAKFINSNSMVAIILETIVRLSPVTLIILRYNWSCVLLKDT